MKSNELKMRRAMDHLSQAEGAIEDAQQEGLRTLAASERADNARKKIGEVMAELDRLLYLETRA